MRAGAHRIAPLEGMGIRSSAALVLEAQLTTWGTMLPSVWTHMARLSPRRT